MYKISKLKKYKELFHVFSTRDEGNMANSILGRIYDFERVVKNRDKFFSKTGIPVEKTIAMWVLGGNGVNIANPKDVGVSVHDHTKAVRTDALLTNKRGLYLMLLTADCLPVIVFDTKRRVVGVIHAGWSGVNLNIASNVVDKLEKRYRTNPSDLVVAFGPAARKESFIKKDPSQKNDKKWKDFVKKIDDNEYSVDFVGLCKKQFVESGVLAKNIIDCGLNTVKDLRFFSHYRDKNKTIKIQGRFACVVGLR